MKKARNYERKDVLGSTVLGGRAHSQRTARCRRKLIGSKITLRSRKYQSQLRERKGKQTNKQKPDDTNCSWILILMWKSGKDSDLSRGDESTPHEQSGFN